MIASKNEWTSKSMYWENFLKFGKKRKQKKYGTPDGHNEQSWQ